MIVECTSDAPAISGDGEVTITGVSTLTVSSKGATAIKIKGAFMAINCTITSIVTKESKSTTVYYFDELYGKITIKTANAGHAGTNSAVYFSIVYDGGEKTTFQRFDNTPKNNTLEQDANEVFNVHFGKASEI